MTLAGNDVELVVTDDGWAALDLVHGTKFDLVISALRVGEMRGMQLYRAAVAADPALAERFYFVTTQGAHDTAPPSSAMDRILTSPLDPAEVRRLLRLD
jgi:CheY-like chemotaxis protein